MITEDIAKFFKEYQVNLMVSFPSVSEDTFQKTTNNSYTYDSVVQGMDFLRKHDISFTPNIVVSKRNLDEIETTAQWLIDRYHCQKLFISRVTRPANAASQFDEYALGKEDLVLLFKICEQLKKRNNIYVSACGGFPFCIFPSAASLKMFGKSCGAGINGYNVDMDGNVYACSKDSESIGNIFADDFSEIRQKLISWGERKEVPEKCRGCRIVNVCRGGCRMTNLDDQRNGKAVDCDADPARAPKAFPRTYRIILPWKKYDIQPSIKVVEYDNIYRVSYFHHIMYLDKQRAELIRQNKKISVLSIIRDLHVTYFGARQFVAQMLHSEIIKP
ncbi:MAG: SPASM domain-containing protein [Roseburia sp.]|nr:SPASM domain-containing protein [Roseburia sp.]MCM1098691.1 SPASM domain-containing protein [Ruminococcus flavefaciens]